MGDTFSYVNIIGEKYTGWLNLFFGGEWIAMVNDVELADRIRAKIPEKTSSHSKYSGVEDDEFVAY